MNLQKQIRLNQKQNGAAIAAVVQKSNQKKNQAILDAQEKERRSPKKKR